MTNKGMILIEEIKHNVQSKKRDAEYCGMDNAWLTAAIEAETERVYRVSEIGGKYIPDGYTMCVMNEGVKESVRVYFNGQLVCTAKTIPAAKRMLVKKTAVPEGYFIQDVGGGFFVHQVVDGVLRRWLKDGDDFVKGYTEQEAKTNLLKYLQRSL